LLPKWYFTSAALTPDFCAMSESDTSIEERSIISSLAATSSLSAVVFLPPGSFVGTLVVNPDAITAFREFGAHNPRKRPHSRVN
jgi:hypothetical protein